MPSVADIFERCAQAAFGRPLVTNVHRDPDQWQFYVADARTLPATKSISLSSLQKRITPVAYPALKATVTSLADRLRMSQTMETGIER